MLVEEGSRQLRDNTREKVKAYLNSAQKWLRENYFKCLKSHLNGEPDLQPLYKKPKLKIIIIIKKKSLFEAAYFT